MSNSASTPRGFGIIFWLIMLVMPIIKMEDLQDDTLLSRYLVLGAFLVIGLLVDRKILQAKFPKWISLCLVSFAVLVALSRTWAYNPSESYAIMARVFIMVPAFFLLTFHLGSKNFSVEVLLKGVLIFAAGAALPTLVELLKALASGDFFENIYVIQAGFSHKNLLASAIMLSFPLVLAAWSILKGPWSKAAMVLSIMMLIEMSVLQTRGVWLSLLGAGLLSGLVWLLKKQKDIAISRTWVLGMIGVAVLILVGLFASPQIKAGITNSSNVQKRMAFWENTMDMIAEHPATGVGAGNWKLLFPKYGLDKVDFSVGQGITHIQRPHNDFLWIWSELGPLGLLLYLGIFALGILQILNNLSNLEDRQQRTLNLAAFFGLTALAAFSFSDFPFERAPHLLFFMLFLAIPFATADRDKGLPFLGYLLPLFLVIGLFVNYQRYQSELMMNDVLAANAQQNARAIIPAAEAVFDPAWYTVDNYANPIPYYSGKGLLFTGQEAKAFAELQLAKEYAPYNVLVWDAMMQFYARKGDVDKALALADTALAISPQFENVLLTKAELHLQRNEFADALAALNLHSPESENQRYLQDLANALRGTLNTYPEHGRFKPMMEHLQKSGNLQQPMDYIRAYRQKRGVN